MKTQYHHICLGGTFDHLHAGHKRMIDFAFHTGEKVSIGLSTDHFVQKKLLAQSIQSFKTRKKYLIDYVSQNNWIKRLSIFPLEDIYGIADCDVSLEAIIVTRETAANAIKINKKRTSNNLQPLRIVSVPFLKGEDKKIVRAERIRKGMINRIGESYLHLFTKSHQLYLPTRLRKLLRKPLGTVIKGDERSTSITAQKAFQFVQNCDPVLTILIGDIVSESLLHIGFEPNLIIRDYRSRRKDLNSKSNLIPAIHNPPGTIKQEAVRAIARAISDANLVGSQVIVIKGEEDLLALPAILLSPLNSIVLYGQADLGIIAIIVTEEKKEQISSIIKQFE